MSAAEKLAEFAQLRAADTQADWGRVEQHHRYLRFSGQLGDAAERAARRRADVVRIMDRISRDVVAVEERVAGEGLMVSLRVRVLAAIVAATMGTALHQRLFEIDERGGVA